MKSDAPKHCKPPIPDAEVTRMQVDAVGKRLLRSLGVPLFGSFEANSVVESWLASP